MLDKSIPGWASKIKPRSLWTFHPNEDVLGQLYGNRETGMERLSLKTFPELWEKGFAVSFRDRRELLKAWLFEIESRTPKPKENP